MAPRFLSILLLICEYVDFGMRSAMGDLAMFNLLFEVTRFTFTCVP